MRGLKSSKEILNIINKNVAPFMGAWIEITTFAESTEKTTVAPFMGAWIEMVARVFYST